MGAGQNLDRSYINLDINKGPDITFWDCRKSLPFDDGSVDLLFAEHVLEHLEYRAETFVFLKECRRCLSQDGVLRIVVPDAELLLSLYTRPWQDAVQIRGLEPVSESYYDGWLKTSYATKMEFINSAFRQGTEHKFMYDYETLALHLRECGFTHVVRQSFGKSISSHRLLDLKAREPESLYVEATP